MENYIETLEDLQLSFEFLTDKFKDVWADRFWSNFSGKGGR